MLPVEVHFRDGHPYLVIYMYCLLYRGMDPLAFAVLCGIGSGVVGYMLGGATFNTTWKLLFKQKAQKLQEVSILCNCVARPTNGLVEQLAGWFLN